MSAVGTGILLAVAGQELLGACRTMADMADVSRGGLPPGMWRQASDIKAKAEAFFAAFGSGAFRGGVAAMARSCKSASGLVRSGVWTLDDLEKWCEDTAAADEAPIPEPRGAE